MKLLPWKFNRRAGIRFGTKTLRINDISLLILDERWNRLFANTPKTPAIERCEEELKELIKEEARLTAEQKEIEAKKKLHMDKIIKLTTEVFEKNNESAKKEMQESEREIRRINNRAKAIEERLGEMPERVKRQNLKLLELTVDIVYRKIRTGKKRVEELERLIEETRGKLKAYIDEKEMLSQDDSEIYSYFHDLLGGEELERLDRMFFR